LPFLLFGFFSTTSLTSGGPSLPPPEIRGSEGIFPLAGVTSFLSPGSSFPISQQPPLPFVKFSILERNSRHQAIVFQASRFPWPLPSFRPLKMPGLRLIRWEIRYWLFLRLMVFFFYAPPCVRRRRLSPIPIDSPVNPTFFTRIYLSSPVVVLEIVLR